ncbi:MAG TPA: MFS transporter [Pirellulales bacterium]|jgi:MFS family permease|nr:MFS transporter [Pirellulales bacterium]
MSDRPTPIERRRALRLGLVNAVINSMGYALTTGAIVTYLAQDLGARGRVLSLLLAVPSLAGLLRLLTPAIISRVGSTKRTCVAALGLGYTTLLGLPLVGWLSPQMTPGVALALLVIVVCSYQLLDFIGYVALWSWFAELVPLRVRGNYFGWRQMLQLLVSIPIALAAGYFADHWSATYKVMPSIKLLGYAIPNAIGAVCMLASLVPLCLMPDAGDVPPPAGIPWRAMLAPFRQWRFRRLLLFRAWLSIANGISQTADQIFPKSVLKLGLGDLAIMRNVMQIGQIGVSRWAGPFSDRYGNRPVLVACQCLVAVAMIFYMVSTPIHAWLLLGAWILWSFYAGHNICLPNLALKLASAREKSPYVAAHDALASFCYAGATVAGGFLFDWLNDTELLSRWGWVGSHPYVAIFALALVLRLLAVQLAAAIVEPGAWRWREILKSRMNRRQSNLIVAQE